MDQLYAFHCGVYTNKSKHLDNQQFDLYSFLREIKPGG